MMSTAELGLIQRQLATLAEDLSRTEDFTRDGHRRTSQRMLEVWRPLSEYLGVTGEDIQNIVRRSPIVDPLDQVPAAISRVFAYSLETAEVLLNLGAEAPRPEQVQQQVRVLHAIAGQCLTKLFEIVSKEHH